MQHFFPTIGQPDQHYGHNFAFNVNLWGNDYVALDNWTPMSGPESANC